MSAGAFRAVIVFVDIALKKSCTDQFKLTPGVSLSLLAWMDPRPIPYDLGFNPRSIRDSWIFAEPNYPFAREFCELRQANLFG